MFDLITRKKIRFTTHKGQLTIEDVWDLNLDDLDDLAKDLRSELAASQESFVYKKPIDETTELSFKAVIYIIDTKLAEREEAEKARKRAERKNLVMEALSQKEIEELAEKSAKELKKELRKLS